MTNDPTQGYLTRLIALHKEIADLKENIGGIYTEAKTNGGLDKTHIKALRRAVRLVMEDADKRIEREAVEEMACNIADALGEYQHTPLGSAAVKREAA